MAEFLDTPAVGRKKKLFRMDADKVGALAEKVARFFGTGEYLAWQTVFVAAWVLLNLGGFWWNWDPYPFILLNLAFSTQAAYSAPLILLAQNRQESRDRIQVSEDRRRAEQTKADTEFLARELASVRIALGDAVTRDYLRHELEDLTQVIRRLENKLDDQAAAARLLREQAHPIDFGEQGPDDHLSTHYDSSASTPAEKPKAD
ncbi:MAG: DUF1003 domain-containing protein [Corynebacterium sp.]|nr:DUF1003 domain-containing protein [Corynebacterium sp.]